MTDRPESPNGHCALCDDPLEIGSAVFAVLTTVGVVNITRYQFDASAHKVMEMGKVPLTITSQVVCSATCALTIALQIFRDDPGRRSLPQPKEFTNCNEKKLVRSSHRKNLRRF